MTSESQPLTRLEYTGINVGPIPYKVPSGRVYRGAAQTYRFVDVFPEDVDFLVGTRKFRKLEQEKPVELPTVEEVLEPIAVPLDTSSVKALRESLKSDHSLSELVAALNTENEREKPRKSVIDLLENAIANDTGNTGNV